MPGNAVLINGLRIGWDWFWVYSIYCERSWLISGITCQIGTFPLSRDRSLKWLNYWTKYRTLNQIWRPSMSMLHVSIISVGEPKSRSHNVISVVTLIYAWWLENRGLIPSSRLEKSLLSFTYNCFKGVIVPSAYFIRSGSRRAKNLMLTFRERNRSL